MVHKSRLALLAAALALGIGQLSEAQVTIQGSVPRLNRILRGYTTWIEVPKQVDDWPGSATVKLDNAKPDLELRLWEVGSYYFLEFVLNTKSANQEILDQSRVTKIADPSDGTGFFWAQLPAGKRVAIDMRCDSRKKICSGKWEKFPYLEKTHQKISVFSSMRGFENREWTLDLDSGVLEKIAPGSMPQAAVYQSAHGSDPGGELIQTNLFNKDAYKNPFSDLQYSPIRIDLWEIKKRSSESGIGFHKQPRTVLYEVTEGVAKIDLLFEKQYSTYEVRKGERLWTPAGSIVAVRSNGGKGERSAVLRRVEFP